MQVWVYLSLRKQSENQKKNRSRSATTNKPASKRKFSTSKPPSKEKVGSSDSSSKLQHDSSTEVAGDQCDSCRVCFTSLDSLVKHMTSTKYICEDCFSFFGRIFGEKVMKPYKDKAPPSIGLQINE